MRSLSNPKQRLVISKIEHTKVSKGSATGLIQYRNSISDMGRKIREFSIKLSPDNLLSVKIALMEAMRGVEEMMRERRKG